MSPSVRRSFIIVIGGLIAALPLSQSASAASIGLSGQITGFHLNSCTKKNCIKLEAATAFTGFIQGSYAFDEATLTITDPKDSKKVFAFHSHDLFYDGPSQKIFIRKITEKPNQEAYYDLKTEELHILIATK